jgi:hypothetical protein
VTDDNRRYLDVKMRKLGHLLDMPGFDSGEERLRGDG